MTLAQNAAEENTFFGWGLLILVSSAALWMRRRAEVTALSLVAGVFALLSLGPWIKVNGKHTGIPSLWSAITSGELRLQHVRDHRDGRRAIPTPDGHAAPSLTMTNHANHTHVVLS